MNDENPVSGFTSLEQVSTVQLPEKAVRDRCKGSGFVNFLSSFGESGKVVVERIVDMMRIRITTDRLDNWFFGFLN